MEALFKLLKRVKALDASQIINEVLKDKALQEFILDLNRKNQLFEKSIDSNARHIKGEYSANTQTALDADRKNLFRYKGSTRKKLAGQPYFLFDSGEFFESFTFAIGKTFFTIDADGGKEDTDLIAEFGKDILGLTDESKETLVQIFQERIIPIIRAEILG